MQISIIVAMDKAGAIGRENRLAWHLPLDLRRFKNITWGHPIIMGRKTFESIEKPLSGRLNIVLNSQKNYNENPFLTFVSSINEALESAKTWLTKEIFIIGGARVYTQFLPICTKIYCTRVDYIFPNTDAFFTEWNQKEWVCQSVEKYASDAQNPYAFQFEIWEKFRK